MEKDFDADVVVIGGGPVGTTALAHLGRAGLTAIGFEQERAMWPTARAVHFDGETMRSLQRLGVANEVRDMTVPMRSVEILNEAGEVLVRADTDRFGSQAWNDHISFHQPDVERLIRGVVEQSPSVELRSGWQVTATIDDGEGVRVLVTDPEGVEHEVRSRWVIAADGARSETRHRLGITGQKYGEDAQWLVVDGLLHDSPGYAADMVQLGTYSRPALWLRLPGDRVRMEFMLMPDDDPDEIVTPAAVERISRGRLPAAKFTPDRQAIYTFRGRIAETWRVGNIFLAGDAAHQAPPLFGQGLCAGIRDVENLVWKLDLVKRGKAEASLLDTYETERKPHATYWVETAANQAVIIQTTDPAVAAQRDAFIRDHPEASAEPKSPPLGTGLHEGDIDERSGSLGIQPILADGTRLDDMVGRHFLVATDREMHAALSSELKALLDDDGETVVLLDPAKVDQLLQNANARGVVYRPDHYVLGVADSPADLERILRLIPSIQRAATAAATK